MRSRKTKEPQSRSKKGFTLAELLIVVAIIGVLVAISIPIFSSQLEKSRKAVDVDNCRAIKSALAMAMIDGSLKITPTNTIKDPCILIVYYKKNKGTYSTDGGVYKVDGNTIEISAESRNTVSVNGATYGNFNGFWSNIIKSQTGFSRDSLKMHQKDPDIAFCGVLLHSDGTCYYVDGTANVPNS